MLTLTANGHIPSCNNVLLTINNPAQAEDTDGSPHRKYAYIGKTAVLKCGTLDESSFWMKDNQIFSGGFQNSTHLILKNVREEDSGIYSCKEKYDTSQKKTIQLWVLSM